MSGSDLSYKDVGAVERITNVITDSFSPQTFGTYAHRLIKSPYRDEIIQKVLGNAQKMHENAYFAGLAHDERCALALFAKDLDARFNIYARMHEAMFGDPVYFGDAFADVFFHTLSALRKLPFARDTLMFYGTKRKLRFVEGREYMWRGFWDATWDFGRAKELAGNTGSVVVICGDFCAHAMGEDSKDVLVEPCLRFVVQTVCKGPVNFYIVEGIQDLPVLIDQIPRMSEYEWERIVLDTHIGEEFFHHFHQAFHGMAESKDVVAQCYWNGSMVEKNSDIAAYWEEQKAKRPLCVAAFKDDIILKVSVEFPEQQDYVQDLEACSTYQSDYLNTMAMLAQDGDYETCECLARLEFKNDLIQARNWLVKMECPDDDLGAMLSVALEELQFQHKTAIMEYKMAEKFFSVDMRACMKHLRRAAMYGIKEAQCAYGAIYLLGFYVNRDFAVAFKWLSKAASQGSHQAQYLLGVLHIIESYEYYSTDKMLENFYYAAQKGNACAQYNIGIMKMHTKDLDDARTWFQKAAEQGMAEAYSMLSSLCAAPIDQDVFARAQMGDPISQYKMGEYYESEGMDMEAYNWFCLSAKSKHIPAYYKIGMIMANGALGRHNISNGVKWIETAAHYGHAEAQHQMGLFCDIGFGMPKNRRKATVWYQYAADQEHAESQERLGEIHFTQGNHDVASFWLSLAAEKGLPKAQYNLGCLYESGSGVEKNVDVAMQWYQKSAAQGYDRAQYCFGLLLEDESERINWMEKAAAQGLPDAEFSLYKIYAAEGEHQDIGKGLLYLRRASEHGYDLATASLGVLYAKGKFVEKDPDMAMSLFASAGKAGEQLMETFVKQTRLESDDVD